MKTFLPTWPIHRALCAAAILAAMLVSTASSPAWARPRSSNNEDAAAAQNKQADYYDTIQPLGYLFGFESDDPYVDIATIHDSGANVTN